MKKADIIARVAREFFQKKADTMPTGLLPPRELSKAELKKIKQESQKLVSKGIQMRMRQVFTPRGFAFFKFYIGLRMVEMGAPIEKVFDSGDPYKEFKQVIRTLMRVKSPVDGKKLSPPVLNRVVESEQVLGRWLRMLGRDGELGPYQWRSIAKELGPLIQLMCRDKRFYLKMKPITQTRWSRFTKLTAKQERIARLEDEDPEAYAAIMGQRKLLAEIDANIRTSIEAGGLRYESDFMMGHPVHIGVDPVTGERNIFNRDGSRIPESEYKDHVIQKRETTKRLVAAESELAADIDNLRVYSDEEVDASNGAMRWASLTDDLAKAHGITRIFKTVQMADPDNEFMAKEIIAEGRFKGIPLEDMINSQGRMLEGTEYTFDPLAGTSGRPVRRDPSDVEPYVSLSDETPPRLYIKVKGHPKNDAVMEALRGIAGIKLNNSNQWYPYASQVVVPPPGFEAKTNITKTKGRGVQEDRFYFTPENFALVREAMGGMTLSEAAAKKLEDYFDDLTRAEQATKKENLTAYTMENLGGFKPSMMEPGLLTKQKESLAWLEAQGDSGVVALDTGLGKTLVSIAMMQKLLRDGWAEPDPETGQMETNGRFLFVVPKAALKGNIVSEIYKFLDGESAEFLSDRVDCMSTAEYSRALKSNKAKLRVDGKTVNADPWNPEQYIAVFFDEAHQYLVNPDNKTCRATLAFDHPRKICLTASPLQKEPMDAYVLAAISNNLDLGDTRSEKGRENRKNMRTFKRRFCEEVGGRIMGVKNDPIVKRDLDTWVKGNIFYADKTNVEEFNLPGLSIQTESVTMDPAVEKLYKETAKKIIKRLEAMTIKFRDKGIIGDPNQKKRLGDWVKSKELEKMGTRGLRPIFKMLNALALEPETVVPGMTVADNPKINRSAELIREQLEIGSKSLLFTDNPKFVAKTARELSKKLPGVHVAAESSTIRFFRGGTELKEWTVTGYVKGERQRYTHSLPFKPKATRMFPNLPASRNSSENRHYNKADWSQFALRQIIQGDLDRFTSLTVYGKAYQSGQNLQGFSTVIHLDRNSWNSENMKQRTARSWRQGQKNPVTEFTLDARYSDKSDENDNTLDEIRNLHQQLEGSLFDVIIKDAQGAELGKEWLEVEKRLASFLKVDLKTAELTISPYLNHTV